MQLERQQLGDIVEVFLVYQSSLTELKSQFINRLVGRPDVQWVVKMLVCCLEGIRTV